MAEYHRVYKQINGRWQWVTASEGGSQPDPETLGRAIYDKSTAAAAVATNTDAPLEFLLSSGDALLDLSDPLHPTVITAGVYAVAATVNMQAEQPTGTQMKTRMELDEDGEDAEAISIGEVGGSQGAYQTVTATYYIPVGGVISVYGRHNNADPQNIGMNVIIQRLV